MVCKPEARRAVKGHIVGLVPPKTFLDEFLRAKGYKPDGKQVARLPKSTLSPMRNATREAEMSTIRINEMKKHTLIQRNPSLNRRLGTLQHFRLVMEVVDCHLEKVEKVSNAVMAVGHAVKAHTDAYTKAGVLLRDVSAGNVMANLLKDGTVEGFLIDWDTAIEVDMQPEVLYVPERTGTWYFLAARLLSKKWDIQDPTKGHCRIDDIESFVHLLVYIASHFTPHEWGASGDLSHFIKSYFGAGEDGCHGGNYKISFLVDWGEELTHVLHNTLLASVISRVCKVLASRYPRKQTLWNGEIMLDTRYTGEDSEALSKPYWLSDLLRDALKKPGWDEAGELVEHRPHGMDPIGGAERSHVMPGSRIAKGYTSGRPDTHSGEYSNAAKGVAGKKRKRGP